MRLPVISAPMFLSSGPELVLACCKAGVVGSFPALNCRTSEALESWLDEITETLAECPEAAEFAMNITVHQSNPRLRTDVEAAVRYKVPVVITSMGVDPNVVAEIHAYGGKVFHDVTTTKHARKAAAAGVDGLILVCAGAGGHAGTLNPFAFIHEVRQFFHGTIALAGAITTGRDIMAALVLGADYAYMGTRFNATVESLASADYKAMIAQAETADIRYTNAICTVPASFLAQSIRDNGLDPDKLVGSDKVDMELITQPYKKEVMERSARPWRDIWSAGQGAGGIDRTMTVQDLVTRLSDEFEAATGRIVSRQMAIQPVF